MPPAALDPAASIFRGCFTAIITPFTPDGHKLDLANLELQIVHQARGGVTGIVVSGTTGESPTLEPAEYDQLVAFAVKIGRPLGLKILAGTGSNSTHHAIELQRRAHNLGVDGALSVNPYYNKPGQEGMLRHFEAQADATPLPVMLYNIPGRTGVQLSIETIEKLAAHPRIMAIKEATGSTDSASEIVLRAPKLALLSGDDSMTLPFMAVGGVGVVSVVSNVLPGKVSELCRAWAAGRSAEALAIHQQLLVFARAMFIETNPIPVKAAMKLLGLDTGSLRLPMTEARVETVAKVHTALEKIGALPRGGIAAGQPAQTGARQVEAKPGVASAATATATSAAH